MKQPDLLHSYKIKMYRTCQYPSFAEAQARGGVYVTPEFLAAPDPSLTTGIGGKIALSLLQACSMMDYGYSVELRLYKVRGKKALDRIAVRDGRIIPAIRFNTERGL